MTIRVSAVGHGRFGRRSEGFIDLASEAASLALERTGRKPIDLLVVGSMLAGPLGGVENPTARLASRLGLETAAGLRVEAASASGAAAFHAAVWALAAGRHERALVVAAEKMTGERPTAEVARLLAASLDPGETAVGATMPALAALVARRYAQRYGTTAADLDAVSVAMRSSSARNPNAMFVTPVSREEVEGSRPIALPIRLLHCAANADGAVAVVLEKGEGPATVRGLGQGFDHLRLIDRDDLTTFAATRRAARQAYGQAGLTGQEIDFAELHDAFAPFALIDLEDIGVSGPGEAGRWFREGWTSPGGRFPVNPSGGILGRGHPVGASGLAGIAEVALQLRGEAEGRALPRRPTVGLAQSIGGLGAHNFVTVLGAPRA